MITEKSRKTQFQSMVGPVEIKNKGSIHQLSINWVGEPRNAQASVRIKIKLFKRGISLSLRWVMHIK
jgi:hypothetical protein